MNSNHKEYGNTRDFRYALTEQEIAEHLGITRQRVYEIIRNALRKMKLAIEADPELCSLKEEI